MISAVIPTFNYGSYICAAIESVLGQTQKPLEVIVVDDGSTDDTFDRLKPYLSRIHYIRQNNRGLSAARNAGIRAASGKWVALLDSDDLWHPQKLEIQLAAASCVDGVGFIGSPPGNDLQQRLAENPCVQRLTTIDFIFSYRFGPSSALIRRTCFEKVGFFDESLRSVEDRDMWLRLSVYYPCARVDSPCWWYRRHPNQMNRNATRMFANYRRVLDNFFEKNPSYSYLRSQANSYMFLDASWSHFEAGERAAALQFLAKSVLRYPMGVRNGQLSLSRRAKLGLRYLLGKHDSI